MTAFLPMADPSPEKRQAALLKHQRRYQYNYTHLSPLAMLDRVTIRDNFSLNWLQNIGGYVVTAMANRAELERETHHRDHHLSLHHLVKKLIKNVDSNVMDLRHLVGDALKFDGRIGAANVHAETLEDYADIFRKIGLPPVARNYQNDDAFAWMRVAGPNPMVIRRLESALDHFRVTDEHLQAAIPCDTLGAAFAEGRVYLCDYKLLDNAEPNDFPHGQKYLYAPLALFVLPPNGKHLVPVAIQCKQQPARDNPIFTKLDGWNWLIAKTTVEIADANMHEAYTHLGRTHLLMEPFAISTLRQIGPTHPLTALLTPHFEGTLAINEAAWQQLVANQGAVDKLAAASIQSVRGLAADAVQSGNLSNLIPRANFAERGVDDCDLLPVYPYRDDSLKYWAAIHKWVQQYTETFYHSDADVVADMELRSWAAELCAPHGGRLNAVPNGGVINNRSELSETLSMVVFTCSVQHAAVNFPQYDLMSYVPNMPLAGYQPAPSSKSGGTEADYLAMLPPLDMAELQQELGYLLGSIHYTQLGQYDDDFADDGLKLALNTFQGDLDDIGHDIQHRPDAPYEYTALLPAGIPQSINV